MHAKSYLLRLALIAALPLVASPILAADNDKTPYVQHENIVYAETDGIGLVMDVFTPKHDANGLGIVDIASGAWSSDRGKINDHKQAQMFNIMCGRGYTVFAVRPGSSSKFTVPEMLKHLKLGIRWVKAHADEYQIDPEKLAITGASAGGHLACLGVTTAEDGNPSAKNPLDRFDTKVKCAAVFFPPTDFLNWGNMKINPADAKGPVAQMIGKLLYQGGISDQTPEEIEEAIRKILAISPGDRQGAAVLARSRRRRRRRTAAAVKGDG